MDNYNRTRHCIFKLTYHVIFATKWRKPVISNEVGDFLVSQAKRLCVGMGGELLTGETDTDHIHMLISLPPDVCVKTVIRILKTQLSKEVHAHKEYGPYVQQFLSGNAPFWSASSFIATTGSVSMETVKSYIESQRTDEHKQKYEKKSPYWYGKGVSRQAPKR